MSGTNAVPVLIDVTADLSLNRRERSTFSASWPAPRLRLPPPEAKRRRKKYRDDWKLTPGGRNRAPQWTWPESRPGRQARPRSSRPSATCAIGGANATPDKAFAFEAIHGRASGGYAPQWIEADLGAPTRLASLWMKPSQLPVICDTTHEIWVSDEPIGDDRTKAKLVHTFKGRTESGQPLAFDFPRGLSARYVQIRTTASASWVAWNRIELRVGRTRSRFVKEEGK